MILLAPVPAIHLQDALDLVASSPGTVAFGSELWSLFNDPPLPAGTPVLLFATRTESEAHPLFKGIAPWQSVAAGRFARWEDAVSGRSASGRRPPTADREDSLWKGFWHVDDLRKLPSSEMRYLSNFRSLSGRRLPKSIPGPTLATNPGASSGNK